MTALDLVADLELDDQAEAPIRLSGLAEPRPLATWWPASDVRSVDADADAEGA